MKRSFFIAFLIIMLISVICLPALKTEAASFYVWNTQQVSISSNFEACMGSAAATVLADETAQMQWPTGFDITGLTISDTASESEVEVYFGSTDCTGTPRIAESTETAANNRDYVTKSGQLVDIKFEDAYTGDFSVKFVDKTDGNSNAILTPATTGNYFLIVRVFYGGEQLAAVGDFIYVGGLNQIQINGTIDPALTLAVVQLGTDTATTTCALGTLSIENIETCGYRTKVSTNANSGYSAYIRADGEFTSGSHNMTKVSAADDIDINTEEYGISSSDTDATIIENTSGKTCAELDHQTTSMPADPLSTSDQSVRASSAPVDGEYTTVCHAAGISGLTPAGAFTQTVTITVVGNF